MGVAYELHPFLTARAAMAHGGSILRRVTSEDVFNLPLYEHHLVIDIRTDESYSAGHLATAVSYPSPDLRCPEEERERGLVRFIKAYVKEYLSPENPSPVVVYGDESPENVFHAEWLVGRLEKIRSDRKMVARVTREEEGGGGDQFNHFEHFCLTIADRAQEIWLLDGGYESFQEEYHFLCGNIEFDSMFPLPHQISKTLFLGTRVFPLKRDALSKLRITHMVVSEFQPLSWEELDGISVLKCAVKDLNSQDMQNCWEASMKFISEATATHPSPRVLVIVFGRSRSTSVILAYLMRTLRLSFEDAWKLVCSKCWHLIDRSLVYEEQLRVWGRREVAAIGNHPEVGDQSK